MIDDKTRQKIEKELHNGLDSQKAGNEGRARVCARRAAGWTIQAHLQLTGKPVPSTIALELIKHFATQEGHSNRMTQTLHFLTVRVKKNAFEEESYYPIEGVDLVAEAHWLVEELLGIDLPLE